MVLTLRNVSKIAITVDINKNTRDAFVDAPAAAINFRWFARREHMTPGTLGVCRYATEVTDKQTNEQIDRQTDEHHRCVKPPCGSGLITLVMLYITVFTFVFYHLYSPQVVAENKKRKNTNKQTVRIRTLDKSSYYCFFMAAAD